MAERQLTTGTRRLIDEHCGTEQIPRTGKQTKQTIALVGNSLLTDTIEAMLKAKPHLIVKRLPLPGDGFERRLFPAPDLIIVDLHAVQLAPILTYLVKYPGVPVLGIEINSNQVIALSSRNYTARCSDDLTHIIKDMVAASEPMERLRVAASF